MRSFAIYLSAFYFLTACNADPLKEDKTHLNVSETVHDTANIETASGPLSKSETEKRYSMAIAEYIKAMSSKNETPADTLFINKRSDFPEISFPASIEKVNIRLISEDDVASYLKRQKPDVLLNVIGWLENNRSEFIIVTFHEGAKPQHNCHLYFVHTDKNEMKLDSLSFEYPYHNRS